VAVLDPGQEKIVWAHTGSYRFQHDPSVLENGRILVFDNNPPLKASAIVEINPTSGEETLVYRGPESDPFYSETCGLAQRLPNGNTLITESDYGRALEVTPDGETVWEFYSPFSAGENDEYIATLMEVVRLPGDSPPNWLKNPGEMPGKGSEGR
ncbi:MAG: arylsulfotransferase family protein, partial [bacterium]